MDKYEKFRSFRDTLFGKVRYGRHKPSGTPVVIKEYVISCVKAKRTRDGHAVNEDALKELHLHAALCKHFRHPHIVQLMDCQADAEQYYAVLEFCERGEFFSFIQYDHFDLKYCKHFFRQLCQGVSYMHAVDICHRDLSLENLLLSQEGLLKICDFGVAIECKEGQTIQDPKGIPSGKFKYMAPEVFSNFPYNPRKADVWSCGVILFIMLTKTMPWETPHLSDQRFVEICSGRINKLLTAWGKNILPPLALDLFTKIFCPAENRLSIKEVLAHAFLADENTEKDKIELKLPPSTMNRAFGATPTPTSADLNKQESNQSPSSQSAASSSSSAAPPRSKGPPLPPASPSSSPFAAAAAAAAPTPNAMVGYDGSDSLTHPHFRPASSAASLSPTITFHNSSSNVALPSSQPRFHSASTSSSSSSSAASFAGSPSPHSPFLAQNSFGLQQQQQQFFLQQQAMQMNSATATATAAAAAAAHVAYHQSPGGQFHQMVQIQKQTSDGRMKED